MTHANSPFSRELTERLSAENLRSFSKDMYQVSATILPGAGKIIFGASTVDLVKSEPGSITSLEVKKKPAMKDVIYEDDDTDQLNPYYVYGKVNEHGKFEFTNSSAFSTAVDNYDRYKAKANILLSHFVTFTLANISDESLILMKATAGSDWMEASIDAEKLWTLIRVSHKLNTNNALLSALNHYMIRSPLEGSVASYCNGASDRKSEFESAFSDFLDLSLRDITEILSSLFFVDAFVQAGVLPLTCDRFLNDTSSVLSPKNLSGGKNSKLFAEVMKTFSKASKNSVVQNIDSSGNFCFAARGKVGDVDAIVKNATFECKNCKKIVSVTWDADGKIKPHDLCRTCYTAGRLFKVISPTPSSSKVSALVQPKPVNEPSPKVRIANTNGGKKPTVTIPQKSVIPANFPLPKKVVDAAAALAASKKIVSFSAVSSHYGLTDEQAAFILSNATPADGEEGF